MSRALVCITLLGTAAALVATPRDDRNKNVTFGEKDAGKPSSPNAGELHANG